MFLDRKNRSELRSINRNVFRGILSHYHEKVFNAYSTTETLDAFFETHVEHTGMNAIEQGLSRGKGVLLFSGHYGGVEFLPVFLASNNYPVTIVAKFKTDDLRNRSMQQAEKFSINIIDADHTPNIIRAIFENLRENRIVITLCDEISEWRPCRRDKIRFLGKQIHLDRTINLLSRRCGAALVFGVFGGAQIQTHAGVDQQLIQRDVCRAAHVALEEIVEVDAADVVHDALQSSFRHAVAGLAVALPGFADHVIEAVPVIAHASNRHVQGKCHE